MHTIPSSTSRKPGRNYGAFLAIAASLCLTLAVVGCSKQSQTSTPTDTTAANAPVPPTANPTAAPAPITDGNILAVLKETDSAEIALGMLAIHKTKNPKVIAFAQMMIHDHSRMEKGDFDLANKLNLPPTPPANDPTPAHLAAEIGSMNTAPTPSSFDTIYINDAVADHANALEAVNGFEGKASAPELKAALQSAIPIIQGHLDHAKDIQKELLGQKPTVAKKK